MKSCRQLERAAQKRRAAAEWGYRTIPSHDLAVTVEAVADVTRVSVRAIRSRVRTPDASYARSLMDQSLFKLGHSEASIGQETGRNRTTVIHSLGVLEEKAVVGSPELEDWQRVDRLVRIRRARMPR